MFYFKTHSFLIWVLVIMNCLVNICWISNVSLKICRLCFSQHLKLAFFFIPTLWFVLFFYRWPWLLPISRCSNMAMCLYSSSDFEKYIILCSHSILSLCGWEMGLLRAYESLKSHVRLTINFDQIEREPLVMPPWDHMMRIFGFFFVM